MTISEQDKVRARAHLGYINAQQASTFFLGVPAGVQTQFVAEMSFTKILPSAEALFVTYLDRMDAIECQIVDATPDVQLEGVDTIKFRADSFKQLIMRYRHWQGAMANMLGVAPNPFDARPWLGSGYNGGSPLNIPVG